MVAAGINSLSCDALIGELTMIGGELAGAGTSTAGVVTTGTVGRWGSALTIGAGKVNRSSKLRSRRDKGTKKWRKDKQKDRNER